MNKDLKINDIAALIIQSFVVGYLFSNIAPQFLAGILAMAVHGNAFDLVMLKSTVMMSILFFLCGRIWRRYQEIKRLMSPAEQSLL